MEEEILTARLASGLAEMMKGYGVLLLMIGRLGISM